MQIEVALDLAPAWIQQQPAEANGHGFS